MYFDEKAKDRIIKKTEGIHALDVASELGSVLQYFSPEHCNELVQRFTRHSTFDPQACPGPIEKFVVGFKYLSPKAQKEIVDVACRVAGSGVAESQGSSIAGFGVVLEHLLPDAQKQLVEAALSLRDYSRIRAVTGLARGSKHLSQDLQERLSEAFFENLRRSPQEAAQAMEEFGVDIESFSLDQKRTLLNVVSSLTGQDKIRAMKGIAPGFKDLPKDLQKDLQSQFVKSLLSFKGRKLSSALFGCSIALKHLSPGEEQRQVIDATCSLRKLSSYSEESDFEDLYSKKCLIEGNLAQALRGFNLAFKGLPESEQRKLIDATDSLTGLQLLQAIDAFGVNPMRLPPAKQIQLIKAVHSQGWNNRKTIKTTQRLLANLNKLSPEAQKYLKKVLSLAGCGIRAFMGAVPCFSMLKPEAVLGSLEGFPGSF